MVSRKNGFMTIKHVECRGRAKWKTYDAANDYATLRQAAGLEEKVCTAYGPCSTCGCFHVGKVPKKI